MGAGEVSPNPELYARMAVPYETADAAQAAIKAFLADVAALREKHRIAEVAMIAVAYHGAEDYAAMTQFSGDMRRSLVLADGIYRQAMANEAQIHEWEAARLRALASDDGEER